MEPERALWHRVAGDILVTGAEPGERPLFNVIYADGTMGTLRIRLDRHRIDNTGDQHRVYGVPLKEKHRVYWLTGPCAWSPARLASVNDPDVKRYMRRRRLRAVLRRLMFWRRA
jgi:hypothetical protein